MGWVEVMKHLAEALKDVVSMIGALVGAVLGIYNLWRAHVREQVAQRAEATDWQRWVEFIAAQREHPATLVFQPEPGSDNHKWAERMVARGMLERQGRGVGYSIRG